MPKIGAPAAWEYVTGNAAIKIAIMDNGADLGHPDLQNAIITGYDAVDEDYVPQYVNNHPDHGHGTCCAGIAAAITNNNTGVAGIAGGWGSSGGCRIMPIRLGEEWVSDDDVKYSFEWATNQGAKVLSNSWGFPGYSYRDPVHLGIKYAYDHGRLVCFASGNSDEYVHYPAADEFSMAVGATNEIDQRCSYSCYGFNLDITAPSRDYGYSGIYTTDCQGYDGYDSQDYYPLFGGTSAACPHVAGLAGLLFSLNSSVENFDVEHIMKVSAFDISPTGWDAYTGYGRIDAGNAVKHLVLPYEMTKSNAASPTAVSNDVWRAFINRPRPEMAPGTYYCDVYEVEQTVNFAIPYADPPWGWLSYSGYANANPNYCTEYLYHSSSNTSITLRTYFYWIEYDAGLNYIGKWAPVDPYLYANEYSVLGRKPINTPLNVNAAGVANSNDIKITWVDNSHNELKFRIERSTNGTAFSLYDSVGQNVEQYIDNNTTQGQKYWYRIQGWAQEFYSAYSNIDDAVAGLAAPSGLVVAGQPTVNSVALEWTDNSLIEAGFQIARRVDDGVWTDNYKTVRTDVTEYTDTVSFMHRYSYKIRAYDKRKGNYSDWSNVIEYTSGALAQSDYPEITAFNNQKKVIRGADGTIHLLFYGGDSMCYTYSTDDGVNFDPWFELDIEYPVDTTPSLVFSGNDPFAVYGSNECVGGSDYRVRYWTLWIRDPLPFPDQFYTSSSTTQDSRPTPPSIIYVGDSCYIVFKHYENTIMVVGPTANNTATLAYAAFNSMPSIGYDQAGRLVVVNNNDGYLELFYRAFNSSWSSVGGIPGDLWVHGSPSLWVGSDQLCVVFEGSYSDPEGYIEGLLYVRFVWSGSAYEIASIELVSANTDWSVNCIDGYGCLASANVVLWRYQGDVWYSRRTDAEWDAPVNVSNTAELSNYPQGVVFSQGSRYMLFAAWTEEFDSEYYLVRQVITLPLIPPGGGPQGDEVPMAMPFAFDKIQQNPTREILRLKFTSPDERRVTVTIYDIAGRVVKKAYDGQSTVGDNEIAIRVNDLSAGVYFVRAQADTYTLNEKVILVQ